MKIHQQNHKERTIESVSNPSTRWVLQVLVLILLVVAVGFLMSRRNQALPHPREWQSFTREIGLQSPPGTMLHPSIAPQGTVVAFSLKRDPFESRADVHLQTIQTETLVQMTSNPGTAYRSAWSADGTELVFARLETSGATGIYRMPLIGGKEQKILESHSHIQSLDWSPDGKALVLSEQQTPSQPWAMIRVSLQDSFRLAITTPPEVTQGDSQGVFSPDGKWVAFVRTDGVGRQDLMLVPSVGGSTKMLVGNQPEIRGLDWHPSGDHLVFAVIQQGRGVLKRYDMNHHESKVLPLQTRHGFNPSFSSDGSKIVFETGTETTAIYELLRGHRRSRELPSFPCSDGLDRDVVMSPDNLEVAFVSARSGKPEIWVCNRQGEAPRQITHSPAQDIVSPRWSPDGKWLAFTAYDDQLARIYTVAANGGEAKPVMEQEGLICRGWSRDGSSLLMASAASGRWELWSLLLEDSTLTQLTGEGGFMAEQALDGETIYYSHLRKMGIWELNQDRESRLVFEDEDRLRSSPWHLDRDGIYYLRRARGDISLCFYRFATKRITVVADLGQGKWKDFWVGRNGKFFLITGIHRAKTHLVLAETATESSTR